MKLKRSNVYLGYTLLIMLQDFTCYPFNETLEEGTVFVC